MDYLETDGCLYRGMNILSIKLSYYVYQLIPFMRFLTSEFNACWATQLIPY